LLTTLVLVLGAGPLAAQHDAMGDSGYEDSQPHQVAFSEGPRPGWTIGAPHLDVNGGVFYVDRGTDHTSEAFIRLHAQAALGIPGVGLASDLQWIPKVGATPIWSAVGQVTPLPRDSRLFLSGGVGVVTGHSSSDRLRGWVQGVLAVRTPVHELAPFVQVGRAFGSGQKAEFLFGLAHPLAPYRFHLP